MFHIITGKPGASKTLHAIDLVERMRAEARKTRGVERPVFYWNIGDVTLEGWTPLGDASTFDLMGVEADKTVARKWYELPRDSIIVFDECQKFWSKDCEKPQRNGDPVPLWVSSIETHRKMGYDILALSQDPTLISVHVRKLCGMHTHYRRIFGTESYNSWTWNEKCVTDVEGKARQEEAQQARGKFPKKWYGTYRSAAVHNVKARLPWKWIATLAAVVVLMPTLVYVAIATLTPDEEPPGLTKEQMDKALQDSKQATVNEVVTQVKALIEANPWDDRLHKKRVLGVDASQPFYDELVRPVSFPKIAGCAKLTIGEKVDCWCNSQQGTKLDMTVRQCLRYLEKGWFDFTKPDIEEVLDEPDNDGGFDVQTGGSEGQGGVS